MGKKKEKKNIDKEKIEEIQKKYAYLNELSLEGFLWEFVRRNEDYKNLYKEFSGCSKHIRNLKWGELSNNKDVRQFKLKFKKFGLKYPITPSIQANDEAFKKIGIESCFVANPIVDILCEDDHPDRILCWEGIPESGHRLAMLIDFTADITPIKSEIEKIVEKAKSKLISKAKKQNSDNDERQNRPRLQDWVEYLKAYDLIKEEEYKPREVAKILYPNSLNTRPDYQFSNKVSNHCHKAEELIREGYKNFLP